MTLDDNATIADALAVAREHEAVKRAIDAASVFGVWGKCRPSTYTLREGDRVEIYRALQADPKVARRRKAGNNRTR